MGHGFRFSVQPKLVCTLLRIPPSLADIGDREKKIHGKEGGKRAVHSGASWLVRSAVNGDLRHINEPVELCPQKLADNTVAHLLRSHTFWLPAT